MVSKRALALVCIQTALEAEGNGTAQEVRHCGPNVFLYKSLTFFFYSLYFLVNVQGEKNDER